MNFDMNSCWSRAVELVQANFSLLLIVAAVFLLLPNVALYMLVPDLQAIVDPTADPDVVAAQMGSMAGPLISGGLFSVVFQFAGYAAMVALMGDARPTVGQALGSGIRTVPSLFAIAIMFFVMYFLGAIAVVVPISLLAGLAGSAFIGFIGFIPVVLFVAWLAARCSMAMPVLVLDGTLNPITALTKSFALTKPKQWPIMGFWIVIIVIMVVASLIFTGIFGVVASLAGSELVSALILGLASGLTGMIYGMVLCAVAVAMFGQLSGPSVEAIEDTFG
ncbi:hypothetical protein [uncultured Erythrobacter sp.]|uniref:hypothetical protein n=1 Tax=uncultured Erythrobacter sp. TaxID=263913 RepID=UPI00263916CB|nr:hypothetical protein [uncultured Erythrobacter sp.]